MPGIVPGFVDTRSAHSNHDRVSLPRNAKRKIGNQPIALGFRIDLDEKDKAPSEIKLFAAGDNETDRGYSIRFDEIAAAMVMEAYRTDGKSRLYADWNHGMLPLAEDVRPSREEGAACCSFVPTVRDGELWATSIEWTTDGRSDVESKKYNLFSPAINTWTDDDNVVRPRNLINFALVNLAGLRNIQPLLAAMASPTQGDTMTDEQIKALQNRNVELETEIKALRASAQGVVALGGVMALAGNVTTEQLAVEARGLVGFRGKVLALTGQDSPAGAEGVLTGWKAKAEGYDKLAAASAEAELAAFDREIDSILELAGKELKVGFEPASLPARKALALTLGAGKPSKAGVDFLKALSETAPKRFPDPATAPKPAGEGTLALTAAEAAYATLHGIKPETALKAKQQIADQNAKRSQGRA